MNDDRVEQPVRLPLAESADLAMKAAATGVSLPDYLGIQVLKGHYGVLHKDVVEFETRPGQGQIGTRNGGGEK
ncbi:hypothetical protein BM43_3180 [Burkholderia gladioli]|uniref:hypothetical protein n=1 Tax=Burkholderia gladioli TaxID=28095 RepID=UPI0005AB538D|nr:hypothetical protein [Burkholderia gladioli]AJW99720.1 hypothetical protein BM43_3180 [Burkholderia gladioli]ASD79136.1 hypothetical protein CEJ98_09030 [Burkholderia gladioli pv. gladioli]AWY55622.1 hypothetical protein A8H28_32130 [Burkholderia gladioli pv. gladioli]SPV21801.1 Uncharacterised protein [Burkholderia gladioli]